MPATKVTVNGRPVDVWIDEEEGKEIRSFYFAELGNMKRTSRKPISSAPSTRATTKAKDAGNGSIRFV